MKRMALAWALYALCVVCAARAEESKLRLRDESKLVKSGLTLESAYTGGIIASIESNGKLTAFHPERCRDYEPLPQNELGIICAIIRHYEAKLKDCSGVR